MPQDPGNAVATRNRKPPLLEYWRPPKGFVYTPSGGRNNQDLGESSTEFLPDLKRRDSSELPDHPAYRPSIISTSSSYSVTSNTTTSSSLAAQRRENRFTWADSKTTLIGIKDTREAASLKSVPWGCDEKAYDEKSKKVTVRVTEVHSPSMRMPLSGPPPAYLLSDYDAEDTLAPHWWQVQYWGLKKKLLAGFGVIATLVIAAVVAYEVYELNRYPNYSALNYTLVNQYSGTDFFDNFYYFTDTSPTNGYVQYVSASDAASYNLTYAGSSSAIVRVDTSDDTTSTTSSSSSSTISTANSGTNSNSNSANTGGHSQGGMGGRATSTTGRRSVRITSKDTWDKGLFIFDVIHTPYGCATWPALWLTDVPNWPANGEIDVMEQVNQATDGNIMTLHTSNGCNMKRVKRKEIGSVSATNCYNGTDDNAGCGVHGKAATYGEVFNNNGGGIMAMELRSAGIRVWQFARGSIPTDITTQTPDPSTWGEALADFPNTHCDIDSHFKNQTIIVNIEICGDWAGATDVYTTEDSCPGTCTEYAASNGTAFETAYFELGNFTIYQAS